MMLRITPKDERDEVYRIPDLALGAEGFADLVINGRDHPDAPGDFRCSTGLRTQVIICLLTDARVDASELRSGDENKGWIGDSFDLYGAETPIGSKLWLLRRSALYDGIEVMAEHYARLALQPALIARRIDATAGSFTAAVASADLIVTRQLALDAGSLALGGSDAQLRPDQNGQAINIFTDGAWQSGKLRIRRGGEWVKPKLLRYDGEAWVPASS